MQSENLAIRRLYAKEKVRCSRVRREHNLFYSVHGYAKYHRLRGTVKFHAFFIVKIEWIFIFFNNFNRTSTMYRLIVFKKMKRRIVLNVSAGALIAAVLTAYGGGSGSSGGSGGGKSAKIKMTTEEGGEFYFYLTGSGVATVDWGDGSEKNSLTLSENRVRFVHTYPSKTIRTITINGDNITGVNCRSNITNLDVRI